MANSVSSTSPPAVKKFVMIVHAEPVAGLWWVMWATRVRKQVLQCDPQHVAAVASGDVTMVGRAGWLDFRDQDAIMLPRH
jgi:hypothetical protein